MKIKIQVAVFHFHLHIIKLLIKMKIINKKTMIHQIKSNLFAFLKRLIWIPV
jgi:hypothetical protein